MDNSKIKPRNLILVIIALAIFLFAFIFVYNIYKKEGEKRSVFIETPSKNPDHIDIFANIVSIDPIKGDMSVRLDFEPKGSLANEKGYLNEDFDLFVNSATGKQGYNFAKHKIMNPVEVTLNLFEGLVTDYPFDKHKAELIIVTTMKGKKIDAPNETEEIEINHVLNFFGSVTGYKISAEQNPESFESFTNLNINIERSNSVMFFSIFVITVMWLLIFVLISLVFTVLVKGRKIEINMFTFTSAMIFAFPAFRNMMPLAPPIGAFPDYVAFFWAEATAALSLVTLILTWVFRKQVQNP